MNSTAACVPSLDTYPQYVSLFVDTDTDNSEDSAVQRTILESLSATGR